METVSKKRTIYIKDETVPVSKIKFYKDNTVKVYEKNGSSHVLDAQHSSVTFNTYKVDVNCTQKSATITNGETVVGTVTTQ
jgi:hypothetical protein